MNNVNIGPGGSPDIGNWFTYHAPSETQVAFYESIREKGLVLARSISEYCPPSPERSTALSKVREAVMWANASIACNQPHTADPQQPEDPTVVDGRWTGLDTADEIEQDNSMDINSVSNEPLDVHQPEANDHESELLAIYHEPSGQRYGDAEVCNCGSVDLKFNEGLDIKPGSHWEVKVETTGPYTGMKWVALNDPQPVTEVHSHAPLSEGEVKQVIDRFHQVHPRQQEGI